MVSQKDIGIIYNPRAGRQRASLIMEKVSTYFSAKGRRVRVRESSRKYSDSDLCEYLNAIDSLIVVGGDGTLRPLLPQLAATRIPVILFAAGNESLISKQFAVPANIPDLFERVVRAETEEHYFSYVGTEPFFLMCSFGFDAEVVKNVSQARTRGSSNLSYVTGGIKAISSYRPPYGTLFLEGKENTDFCGPILVGNSPFYGRNFLPVAEANSRNKEFALRYFDEVRLSTISNWLLSAITNKALAIENAKIFYTEEIKITLDEMFPAQVDGDYLGEMSEIVVRKSESKILFLV